MEQKVVNPRYIDFIQQKEKRKARNCVGDKIINSCVINKENKKIDMLQQIKELVNELEGIEIYEKRKENVVLNNKDKDIIKYESEYIAKIKEEEKMKRINITKLKEIQVKFLLLSFSLTVIALINLLMFLIGAICINPYISIFLLIMGIGWGATAIAAIFEK